MQRAAVIINGYPSGEKFLRQGERIAAALSARGIKTDVIKNGEISVVLTNAGNVKTSFARPYTALSS